jgi:hypothetical protein
MSSARIDSARRLATKWLVVGWFCLSLAIVLMTALEDYLRRVDTDAVIAGGLFGAAGLSLVMPLAVAATERRTTAVALSCAVAIAGLVLTYQATWQERDPGDADRPWNTALALAVGYALAAAGVMVAVVSQRRNRGLVNRALLSLVGVAAMIIASGVGQPRVPQQRVHEDTVQTVFVLDTRWWLVLCGLALSVAALFPDRRRLRRWYQSLSGPERYIDLRRRHPNSG